LQYFNNVSFKGLRRGKFDYPTLMNRKPRANGEDKKEGGTHVMTAVPT